MSGIATVILFVAPTWSLPGAWKLEQMVHWIGAVFLLALTCGVVRERSGSLLASVIIHVLAATAAWYLVPVFLG
jgi:hypothetical protein